MNRIPLARRIAALLFAACLAGGAHAATITGISASPANPTAGQQVTFTINLAAGSQCGIRLVYGNGEPSDNTLTGVGNASIAKTLAKAGTYQIQAIGSPTLTPGCTGQAAMTLVVKEKPAMPPMVVAPNLVIGGMVPMCPPAPYKEDIRNLQTGKLHCYQPNPSCPTGWKQASFNDGTGQLQCVTAVDPVCPAGFDGSYAGGVLKCVPKPQPKVACVTGALPQNPWGTSYYAEGWNRLGCSVNLAPPK
ncbi:hypothetical protein FN976_22395 [Caenimonas sedimenti]|uniref:Uncharacterized protein n=1 Tax=Caenimonas sedimenti TaxID=2596921 RepID=A0A562ZJS9_9BURK|nr:hypothetical protein [Caenimonas sedimenti]TWO68743.1 hypothetical protein FN976_22395 [Caenimonas sedimenti]